MHKFEVTLALEAVRDARKEWGQATAKFNSEVEVLMARLLNEAAVQKMSVAEVARDLGTSEAKVRAAMRRHGLNPKAGRNLLAKKAAETLSENAALLGVEPHEFDLTSPLAYLPMGAGLRKFLETSKMDEADLNALADEYGDARQLAMKLTDAGLTDAEAVNWVDAVITRGQTCESASVNA